MKIKRIKRITAALLLCALLLSGCSQAPQKEVEPSAGQIDLNGIVSSIHIKDDFKPELGIVLGSGLGGLADEIEVVDRISYRDIPGFPHSTVEGHAGEYIFGYLEGVPVVLMNGRVHYYEGYTMEEAVTPDRVMALLGAQTVILTNAVGSLRKDFPPGTLVCIEDHISSFIPNPLIGQNNDELGSRFVDMTNAYDSELRELLHEAAAAQNIDLKDGVFCQVTGPSYETKAESELFASLGADTVGMSTACETIALRHMGIKVLGINCVTNYCPNCVDRGTSHEEVQNAANQAGGEMIRLLKDVVRRIKEQ